MAALAILLLTMAGCANTPHEPGEQPPPEPSERPAPQPAPQPPMRAPVTERSETDILLDLTSQVIQATSADERRAIEQARRAEFESDPSYDNLLRLTLVRALSAALPAELKDVRADLQALANGRAELSPNQRQLALLALIMVDERLQMGDQITNLQRQIDSLTEIEASLNQIKSQESSP